jgi:nucleotide-binding universal stress UspA family protein
MNQLSKRILFASDLSTDMKTVFEQAVALSAFSNADIVVLHVMEEASKYAAKLVRNAFGESLYKNLKNEQKAGAQNLLTGKNVDALRIRQAIAGFFANGEAEAAPMDETSPISKILVTESQSISTTITQTAVEEDCDTIIIGCKQQGLLAEAVGENVVRKVINRTSVPVLIVPLGKK